MTYIPEPAIDPPEDKPLPTCPACGEEAAIFFVGENGKVIGYNQCITVVRARQYMGEPEW